MQPGALGRADVDVVAAPADRLAPEVQEASRPRSCARPRRGSRAGTASRTVRARSDSRRAARTPGVEAVLLEHRRQQERPERAPAAVDAGGRLRGRDEFGERGSSRGSRSTALLTSSVLTASAWRQKTRRRPRTPALRGRRGRCRPSTGPSRGSSCSGTCRRKSRSTACRRRDSGRRASRPGRSSARRGA